MSTAEALEYMSIEREDYVEMRADFVRTLSEHQQL